MASIYELKKLAVLIAKTSVDVDVARLDCNDGGVNEILQYAEEMGRLDGLVMAMKIISSYVDPLHSLCDLESLIKIKLGAQ